MNPIRIIRGSRNLFVLRSDSFSMNPEKRDTHSLNNGQYKVQ